MNRNDTQMTPEEDRLVNDAIRIMNGEGESYIELKALLPDLVQDGETKGQEAFDWMMRAESKGTLEADFGWDELPHSLGDVITATHSLSIALTRVYATEIAEYATLQAGPGKTLLMPENVAKRMLPAFSVGYSTRLPTLLMNRPNRNPSSPKDILIATEAVRGLEADLAQTRFKREAPPPISSPTRSSPPYEQRGKSGCAVLLVVVGLTFSVLFATV